MTSPMPASAAAAPGEEMTYWKHGWEKCKKNPIVPLGAAATTVALLGATASLRSGNRKQFQNYLRLRVAAQGVTVVAMVIGAYYLTTEVGHSRQPQVAPAPAPPPPARELTEDEHAHLYPPRTKTKVSEFTKRLRESDDKSF